MSELLLHPATKLQLELVSKNPKGSYIFYGESGVGKALAARRLAQRLNCSCQLAGTCANCRLMVAGNFPDLVVVEPEKASIGIAQIQALQQGLSLSRYYHPGHRLVVIDQAELMTREAQNCLLKTLEEPPERTLMILLTSNREELLPTVRSRCAEVYFAVPDEASVQALLVKQGYSSREAQGAAGLSQGLPGVALRLLQEPEALAQLKHSEELAERLLGSTAFERLAYAQKAEPEEAGALIQAIARQLRARLRTQYQPAAVKGLEAVERFKRHINANVAPKAALEACLLEV